MRYNEINTIKTLKGGNFMSNVFSDKFDDNFTNFIKNSGYYKSYLHTRSCRICKLPKKIREKIDIMILEDSDHLKIQLYLTEQFPKIFKSTNHLKDLIDSHKKYLPYMLEDTAIKTIFKRARYIVENKNIEDLTAKEKAKMISEIEAELIKEYSDMENERISLVNVMFKETMPLILTRLHASIVEGTAKEIKTLTEASNMVFKMSTAMAASNLSTKSIDEESIKPEEVDFSKLDEEPEETLKSNVLSLTERINKATKGVI
jgi:hypothetical protein